MNADERRVLELLQAKGMEPTKANQWEDSALHIDLWATLDGKRTSMDVKGPRRYQRQDQHFAQGHTWLELRNRHGLRGSLFGRCDWLVIASPRGWLWLDRHELACETVLRYIENAGKRQPLEDWYTKHRGHSVIVLAPFAYLYKQAAQVWEDQYLAQKYATNTEERHPRPMGEAPQGSGGPQGQGAAI